MEKYEAREWIASLEEMADNKLKKWRKENKIENGEAIQLHWQYEQSHIMLDIFWEDKKELVILSYLNPRSNHSYTWHGLGNKTFNKLQDRIGHLALVTMHPPIDPEFNE